MKKLVKTVMQFLFLLLALPLAVIAGFGKFVAGFRFSAQACATAPGLLGDYLRIAYYRMTLERCSPNSRISFGSFFAHPQASVGDSVYIGAYCVMGKCSIGDRTQIASHVQLLSGRRQHGRDATGQIASADEEAFERIDIGADCWIGASAVVMASIGDGTTIGAGAIVTKPVEAGVVAVGNPARILPQNNS